MLKVEKLADKAVLTIYGYVGGYFMDYRNVAAAVEEVKKTGYKKLDFRMHTYGGSVFEGNLIYNFLSGFNGELNIYIDGVAASMGFIIMLAAKKENIHIASNGLGMCHCPSGSASGTAKDLEQSANLLRLLEKQFKAVLKQRTGKSDEEIEAWFDGSDHWFDADGLIALGLVGNKFDPQVKNIQSLDTETASSIGAKAAYDRFAALTTNISQINNSKMNKPEVIAKFGLTSVTAESSDEEIYAAIQAKMDLKDNEVKAEKTKAITAAIDGAIAVGKIAKEQKDEWVLRGEKLGIEDLNAVLGGIQKPTSILDHVKDKGSNGSQTPNAEREGWTWDDYQAKAPRDLEAMRYKDPETFKALFKAEYGTDPEL